MVSAKRWRSKRASAQSDDEKAALRARARQYDQIVGRRLRQARLNAGLSQNQLGMALGLSFQSIQRYEHGIAPIGAGRLIQIAAALEIVITFPFQDLIDFDGFAAVNGGQGIERPPPLTRDAYRVARNFDAISDAETRAGLQAIIRRLSSAKQ